MSWEDTFQSWAKPPGETEQAKCDNAERAVKKAIDADKGLAGRGVTTFRHGSYNNRTNVRIDSDVDVGVLYSDTIFFDLPQGMQAADFNLTVPASYQYSTYKNDVERALESYLGNESLTRGNKAFGVHENTYRVDADVVACFEYRRYYNTGTYRRGVAFNTDRGARIINYPQQNYDNGVAKNNATDRRFKSVVRILKRLQGAMEEDGIGSDIPGFLIECLVWNVPNEGFGHDTVTADVQWTLAHLFNNTRKEVDCKEWTEINEYKYLFHLSQPWKMEVAHNFASAAWDYIGFD